MTAMAASATLTELWSAGSLPLALGAALVGVGLLLALRLLRRRTTSPLRTAAGDPALGEPQPATPAPLRARAEAAYAGAGAMGSAGSSSGTRLPIAETSARTPATHESREPGTPCPAALSRRIDRLEARVRARRAASRG